MQKYIGNIVVGSPNYKVDKCFKKFLSLSEVDNDLPTLIIGLERARSVISDFYILKREYGDKKMLWWTLSKTEKRIDYDKNITDFYNFCIKNILKNVVYTNINIINLKYSDCKTYIDFIRNNDKKYYYIDNNKFIFVYDVENNEKIKKIYGFSLNTVAFFGISRQKIVKMVENNPKNTQIKVFYSIPTNIRRLINNDIVSKMVLNEYFM